MRAYCLIRPQPWYRREAFAAGLKAAGHTVSFDPPPRPDGDTLLMIWNRYGAMHDLACRVESAGGRVLVAENGYLGRGGTAPKFDVHPGGPQPHHYYAIAEGWHNGGGRWFVGGPERFDALGVDVKPWREAGDHVLICPNRSFGVAGRMMDPRWPEIAAEQVRKQTKRPVRIRPHPGNDAPKRSLAEDLVGAWACVVWTSGAAVHALVDGIPVFVDAPYWIMKGASAGGTIDDPVMPERRPHFERLAWAQWTVEEIASGEPFCHLLPTARQAESAACL